MVFRPFGRRCPSATDFLILEEDLPGTSGRRRKAGLELWHLGHKTRKPQFRRNGHRGSTNRKKCTTDDDGRSKCLGCSAHGFNQLTRKNVLVDRRGRWRAGWIPSRL